MPSYLTTFITPFGRFRYLRLPFGISSDPEHFQQRMLEILKDLEGVVCLIDDIVIHCSYQEKHDKRLKLVLRRLVQHKVTLNIEKCEFSKTKIKFLGQVIYAGGVRPDPKKVDAIKEMKRPNNVHEVRSFLGMVNQQAKFIPELAEITKPLRDLLSVKNQFVWEDTQAKAFDEIKKLLTSDQTLALYDRNLETVISSDASSFGIGSVIKQRQPEGHYRPVAYASRSLTAQEMRYTQIEKEALALTWACERCNDYILGMDTVHLETDHKPYCAMPLLSKKDWNELPIRIQRFKMRLMRYRYTNEIPVHHIACSRRIYYHCRCTFQKTYTSR